jgi:nucleoside-diphosphate-sugar epimerase
MVHLITGGSGYLGVAIARKLAQKDVPVRIYDLSRSNRLPAEVEFAQGDVRDIDKLKRAMADCAAVHHLVGIMPQARASRERMQAVNVGGTENVLRGASETGMKRVVFVSSSEVYGRPQSIPIKEDDPLEPICEYGRNKVASEKLCYEYREKTGIEVVILRPPTIVGPEMDEPTFLRSLEMARRGRFVCIGPGDHRFQMSYVDDVAEACILASQREGVDGDVFNIGAEGTLPFKKQLQEVARYLKKEPKVRSIPSGLFKTIMKILYPFGLSPLEPEHLHLLDADFVMDVSKARTMLGWIPTRTDLEMLIETYEWYHSARQ